MGYGPPDEGCPPNHMARFAREPSPQPFSRRRGEQRVHANAEDER